MMSAAKADHENQERDENELRQKLISRMLSRTHSPSSSSAHRSSQSILSEEEGNSNAVDVTPTGLSPSFPPVLAADAKYSPHEKEVTREKLSSAVGGTSQGTQECGTWFGTEQEQS